MPKTATKKASAKKTTAKKTAAKKTAAKKTAVKKAPAKKSVAKKAPAKKTAAKKAANPNLRTETVSLSLTPAEKTKLESLAHDEQVNVPDYIRTHLLNVPAAGVKRD